MVRIVQIIIGIFICSSCYSQTESVVCAYQDFVGILQSQELVREVRTKGSLLFVGEERGMFVIYDTTDSPLGEEIGSLDTGDHVFDFEIVDDYAYLANDDFGLTIVDISDPTVPYIVGRVVTPSWAIQVTVRDGYAYLSGARSGVHIIDVHDPTNPMLVSSISWFATFVLDLQLENQYLYIADQYRLIVVDVSDPTNPVEVSQYSPQSTPESICLIGDHLLIMPLENGNAELLDLNDPRNPLIVSAWIGLDLGVVEYDGNRLFSRTTAGLSTYHLTDDHEFIFQGEWRVSGCYAHWVTNDGVYLSSRTQVRYYQNPTPPASAVLGEVIGFNGEIGHQVLDGGLLYAVGPGRLWIFDVNDHANPVLLTELLAGGSSNGRVCKLGSNVVIILGPNQFRVIDVSDPLNPVAISAAVFEYGTEDLVFVGDYLCVSSGDDGVAIFDLTNPSLPNRIGALHLSGYASDITMINDTEFAVLVSGVGIVVVDISDPANPVQGDMIEFNRTLYDIDYDQGIMVVTSNNQFDILTRSLGSSWEHVSLMNGPFGGLVTIEVPYLFISGMTVFDLSNPSEPQVIGEYMSDILPVHASVLDDAVVIGLDSTYPNIGGGVRVINMFSGCGTCYADLTGDGTLNFFDVSAFLASFLDNASSSDWNSDSSWDIADVLGFLMDFQNGCP